VKIYRDNWLPRPSAMKVEGRRRSLLLKWVSELINHENMTWREELVRDLFLAARCNVHFGNQAGAESTG
jgi:hypothetical protein